MTPDAWERIKDLFASALSRPPEDRAAHLAKECEGQPELRDAVLELLAANAEASNSFLDPGGLVLDVPWLFRPGDSIAARFTVLRPIARGASGEVYEAEDERLHQRIAVKAVRPQLAGDPLTRERLRREALVTRNIAHDGLCRIFDLVEHTMGPGRSLPEGTVLPCLTMQLLQGESLEEHLVTHRPLTTAEAFPLLMQIASTLDALHEHGVLHRDLKPSNVMLVERDGIRRAVLTDFGLAKPVDESLFETESAIQGGAPYFMAPELFRGEKPSRASDIYAFGLLLDEMVTLRRAFSADTLHGLVMQKAHELPVPPSARATDLPPAWEQGILRCLAKHPADRFPSATDACAAIADDAAPGNWQPSLVRRLLRTRAGRWASIAGALLVAVGGATAMNWRAPRAVPKSVVVLPFENLTGDANDAYVAAGTAGELGRRLSRVPEWSVYSTGDANSPDPIDPERRASYTLRGHVQRVGSAFRITVQLVERATDRILWGENFDGAASDALALQERLAESASTALFRANAASEGGLKAVFVLLPWNRPVAPAAMPGGTRNSEAYDLYMRASTLASGRELASTRNAAKLLQRAIELDPEYAAPHALLADIQGTFMDFHEQRHELLLAEAERHAEEAVRLAPDSADAQISLAAVRQMQYRWPEAEAAFKRALELHPTHSRGHRWYGGMLLQFGRYNEAFSLMERALRLDPYDYPSQSAYGLALFYADRPEEAVAHLENLLKQTDHIHARFILGQVYAYLASRGTAARDEYLRRALQESDTLRLIETTASRRAHPGEPPKTEYADLVGALAWSYRRRPLEAQPFVGRLEADVAAGRTSPSFLARVFAVQNRQDLFFKALADTEEQHDRELMYLRVSPLYASVRTDPRFVAVERRLNLIP
jgi:TolB-like protein/tRNA A-37 threonylcarbamoyl transferase component Bud32/Flp pilus assembly protein TadD